MRKQISLVLCCLLMISVGRSAFAGSSNSEMSPQTANQIAMINAAVNACLAERAIDRTTAFEYLIVAGQVLATSSSLPRQIYDRSYSFAMEGFKEDSAQNQLVPACIGLAKFLPESIQALRNLRTQISLQSGAAEGPSKEEVFKLMQQLDASPSFNLASKTLNIPFLENVVPKYAEFLLKKGGGLRECRTAVTGFVFCF
jgi:hypothetical protein